MKQKSIIYLLLFSFTFGATFSSCEDMLDVQSDRHSYETAQDTLYAYWGILKTLQNVGERYVLLGELRGDLVMENFYDGEVSDSLKGIANFTSINDGDCRYLAIRDFYAIINNCNAYIASADLDRMVFGGTTQNSKYMLREFAQVEAIRAWTYLQLVQLYKEVPFYLDPLTSTDAIEDFLLPQNLQTINAAGLVSQMEQRLLPLISQEDNNALGYPQYGNYDLMAHSSYCFFPLHLVMGDIYLNANEYEKAAEQYYLWMQNDQFSAVPNIDYNYALASVSFHNKELNYSTGRYNCFNLGSNKRSNTSEAITVIPGTTNKLWGNVLRGVNEAFGFTSKVRVNTTGTDTASVSSSVTLTPVTYKRQFIASNEFKNLCKSYPFFTQKENSTAILPDYDYDYLYTYNANNDVAGDARYGWYSKRSAQNKTGDYAQDSMFIMKQNPSGVFSTTFPVVYRRALVWLRFAEAINRAGYPEYAYAILRDGMYVNVLPSLEQAKYDLLVNEPVEILATDVLDDEDPTIVVKTTYALLPKGTDPATYPVGPTQTVISDVLTIENLDIDKYQKYMQMGDADEDVVDCVTTKNVDITGSVLKTFFVDDNGQPLLAASTINDIFTINSAGEALGYKITSGSYIPANRMVEASKTAWGRFLTDPASCVNFDANNDKAPSRGNTKRLGIHQRGNSYNAYAFADDPFYNFDVCVKSKWAEYNGPLNKYLVSTSDYEAYTQNLIKAVEELIIDELAMECCFEGNRYNDLVRFSTRDGRGAAWLTAKVNKRSHRSSVTITDDNMYLKLPNK